MHPNRFALSAALALVLALSAACGEAEDEPAGNTTVTPATNGSQSTPSSTASPKATTTTTGTATGGLPSGLPSATATAAGQVGSATPGLRVTETEFALALDPATVPSGTVRITVRNSGAIEHNLAVVQTDRAPDSLPATASATADLSDVRVVAMTDGNLRAGSSEEIEAALPPGKYVLLCNVPAHYQSGMRAALTVQ